MITVNASPIFRRLAYLACMVLLPFSSACRQEDPEAPVEKVSRAREIVNKAVAAHGGDILDHARMSFDFRGRKFLSVRNDGLFRYERSYTDSTGQDIREILDNDGFEREINGITEAMDSTTHHDMLTSVNSVIYFALLPLPLRDPATREKYLGETTIEGEPYDKIEITFDPEGGGRDYQDRFIYWFHRDRHTMDYMAYYYYVDESGSRFRKAVNVRNVSGVRIQDYINMKSDSVRFDTVESYDRLFEEDRLKPVSEIRLEHVRIEEIPSGM